MEFHEKEIAKIIRDRTLEVSEASLRRYLNYLKSNMDLPCLVTGREGDYFEYSDYGRDTPSADDSFELIGFCEDVENYSNIFGKVRYVGSSKIYELQLFEFKTVNSDSDNSFILDLYAMWIEENL